MKRMLVVLAFAFGINFHLSAQMGDSSQQASAHYGQPTSTQATPGAETSLQTFLASGLQIICGFVNNQVEAVSFSRTDRAFVPTEIQALLNTNSQHKNWVPSPTGDNYTRADGTKAVVKGNSITLATPKWLAALARDQEAAKGKAEGKGASSPVTTGSANAPSP